MDVNGRVFIHDLESMHGTSIQGERGTIPITVPSGRALQVLDGDMLIFGKQISMRGQHHQPLRLKATFRFPAAGKLEGGRQRRTEATFASEDDIYLVDSHLNPSPDASNRQSTRRFSYGIPESLLYESDADEDLPRGTPTDDMGDPVNDDIIVIEDDEEDNVLPGSFQPVVIVEPEVAVDDNDVTVNLERVEETPARPVTNLVSAPTIDLTSSFSEAGDADSDRDEREDHGEGDDFTQHVAHVSSYPYEDDHYEENAASDHDEDDRISNASSGYRPEVVISPPYRLDSPGADDDEDREPSPDPYPIQQPQASFADLELAFDQVAEQVVAEVQATFGDAIDRLFNDFAGDRDNSSDDESNHAAADMEGPLASVAAAPANHPGFYHSDDESVSDGNSNSDGYHSDSHDDEDADEHEDEDGSDKDWGSESEAKVSDDEHDSEGESASDDDDEDEHDDDVAKECVAGGVGAELGLTVHRITDKDVVVAAPGTQDKSVGVSSYHTAAALPSPPLSAGDESPVYPTKVRELEELVTTPTATRTAGLLTPPSTRKRTFAVMEDAEVDATGAAPVDEVSVVLETPSKTASVKATTPAAAPDFEAPARPAKRQRSLAGDVGILVLGVTIGAVGTIAGLLQLAGE